MEMLLKVFAEAAHNATIFPFASEATLYAMKSFGGFDLKPAVIAAIAGGLLGHSINWSVGKMLMRLPASPRNHRIYLKVQDVFNRYGFFLLVFAFAPLMNVVVMASGLLGTPLKKALPLIGLGLCYHYGKLLF